MKSELQKFTSKLTMVALALLVSGSAVMAQGTVTVGTADDTPTTTEYPAPLADYYKQDRQQYLFLASELAAAGLAAGDITAIGWDVIADYIITDLDLGVIESYTIKMANTEVSSLDADWVPDAVVVWGPADYIPVGSSLNEFTLDAPFTWDGTSNLIVEVCGGISTGNWEENAIVAWNSPGFTASRTYRSDTYSSTPGAICDYDGAPSVSSFVVATNRPVTNFTGELAEGCAGTPDAGAAISTAEAVCADEEFSVSVPTGEVGSSYQWQSSADGVSYSDIDGATGNEYTTTQSEATYYRCVVTCDATGDSDNSDAAFVDQLTGPDCLCTPTFTSEASGDYINDFEMAGISNLGSGEAVGNYIDYTGTYSTDLVRGANYVAFTDIGPSWDQTVKIYIDLNHDGVLSEEESVACKWVDASTGGRLMIATIPEDATLGTTIMRVMCEYGTIEDCDFITSCMSTSFGEAEDYEVTIVDGDVCPAPTGVSFDPASSTSGTISWDAMAGAEDYQVTIRNASTLESATATVEETSLFTDNLNAGVTYQVRVRTNCGDEISDPSSLLTFTTDLRLGEFENEVSIYPNPSEGLVRIQLNGYEAGDVQVMIANQLGQIVYSNIINVMDEVTVQEVDLSDLAAGTYMVRIINGTHMVTRQVVIE